MGDTQHSSATQQFFCLFFFQLKLATHVEGYPHLNVQFCPGVSQHHSLGAVHSADSVETWRVHYIVNVISSARDQAELSI